MALKDYYMILGIPRGESNAGIRAAYRDLAKQYHPDVGGTADAGRFRELTEAYEVLSRYRSSKRARYARGPGRTGSSRAWSAGLRG